MNQHQVSQMQIMGGQPTQQTQYMTQTQPIQFQQPQLNMNNIMQQSILQASGPIFQRPLMPGFGGLNPTMIPQGSLGQKPAPFTPGVNGAITMPHLIQQAGFFFYDKI